MARFLIFSGSFRKGSYNSALVRAFIREAGAHTIEQVDYSDVPLYNQDLEEDFPVSVDALKTKIREADGIIIATPEYNRSVPGVLKNMIDWTSRPYGDSAWTGKPVLVVGASGGTIATALAQYDLKKVLLYVGAHVLGQPEFMLGLAGSVITDEGEFDDDDTIAHVQKALTAFAAFAERYA